MTFYGHPITWILILSLSETTRNQIWKEATLRAGFFLAFQFFLLLDNRECSLIDLHPTRNFLHFSVEEGASKNLLFGFPTAVLSILIRNYWWQTSFIKVNGFVQTLYNSLTGEESLACASSRNNHTGK